MPGNDLVFFVRLRLKPECVEEWKQAVAELIDRMSREDTFVTCLFDQSTEDVNVFTLYERWREQSPQAFIKNQMKEYRKVYEEKLPSWLAAPRTAIALKPIREWHRKPGT